MRYSNWILLFLAFACAGEARLKGFDNQGWQDDRMGCQSKRLTLIDDLMARKSEITGLGQEEISKLLGKPDQHELSSRNKKSFTYFLAQGPGCPNAVDNPPKLIIRFDGLGRSKDIIYYKLAE